MTVQELIDELQKVEDKSQPIIIRSHWDGEASDCTDITLEPYVAAAYDCGLARMGHDGWNDRVECIRLVP